jgi:uncharacterized RDD family membrane protein YckC
MTEPTPPTVEPTPPSAELTPTAEPTAPAPATGWTAPEPTPGPAPGVEFAEPGARLIAYIIDVLIITGVSVMLALVGAVFLVILPIIGVLIVLAAVVFGLAYFPYFWAKDGQTIGARQQRIRVVRDVDGGPLSTGSAILRLVGYWISGAVFYIGFIWIFVDQRRRGWMDLIAGTVVVKA